MKKFLIILIFLLLIPFPVFGQEGYIQHPQSNLFSPGPIGSTTPSTGAFTTLQWTVSAGPFSDHQYIPIDAGIDSVMSAPDAAIRVQGTVGSTIAPVPANVSYAGTCTIAAPNITTCAWATSGTQTLTLTINPVVVGKLYQLNFTPTFSTANLTFTATSGVVAPVITAMVTTVPEVVYFRATATTAVFTFTSAATETFSTASTTCFEYTRPAIGREFSNSIQQSLVFDWMPPVDWNGGTITFKPMMVVSNATGPAEGNTIIWSMSGFAIGDSDSLSQATGTAVSSTYTQAASPTNIQYDEIIGTESAAITLANSPAAGKKVRLILDRLADGYAQKIALTGIKIKYTQTLAP